MTQKHQLKGYSTYWTKHNLLHHCITDKDQYIHVVRLYTQHDLKCRLVITEKRTINVYLFYVPNFQKLI